MGESYLFKQQHGSNLQLLCSVLQETPVHSSLNLPFSQKILRTTSNYYLLLTDFYISNKKTRQYVMQNV